MTDLAFIYTGLDSDLGLTLNDINTDKGLETAVSISLFTDRRASKDDVIVDDSHNKRGCWMDSYPEVEGDLIGSRLWLLFREKSQQNVINRAKEYITEALQWMVDDGVAKSVESTVRFLDQGVLQMIISITRPLLGESGGERLSFQFAINWQQQALK